MWEKREMGGTLRGVVAPVLDLRSDEGSDDGWVSGETKLTG